MTTNQRYSLILPLIVISAGAVISLRVAVTGWPMNIIRDHQYRKLIEDYHQARRLYKKDGGVETGGQDFQIQTPESQTTVLIRVPPTIGVVNIKYEDEGSSRALYRSAEYTQPIELKMNGPVLYVHWLEPLFGANHWILAYDLAGRREIRKRRVDPSDLLTRQPQTGASTEPPSEKIVQTGTVTAISQVYAPRPSLRNWGVTIRVEKVKEGKFSHPEFTFTVHSPAMAGLEVGRRCTIEATWTGQGYLVDDSRWMRDGGAVR
jgi:hypothetical protein